VYDFDEIDNHEILPIADHYGVEDMRRDSISFQLAHINVPLSSFAVIADFQRSNILDRVTELRESNDAEQISK